MRRHRVISKALGHKLSGADLLQALRICDEEFARDEDFSAAKLCQHLSTSLPDTQLGKQTRLLVLHNVRQPGSSPQTESMSNRTPVQRQMPVSSTPPKPSSIEPERRRDKRKVAQLTGTYIARESNQSGSIVVENISEGGARLHLKTPRSLKRGEILLVQFALDDQDHTPIHLSARVTWSVYDTTGVAFISPAGLPQVLINYIRS